ncbi:MAG: hypothetical protein ACOX1A_06745 [Saccharofermentanales bacterium]
MGHSVLAAFGSTRRKDTKPEDDPGLADLLSAGTATIVVFGKVWDVEVHENLCCSLEENLAMIRESIAYLRAHGREVIFDAEHYFEAAQANPDIQRHACGLPARAARLSFAFATPMAP